MPYLDNLKPEQKAVLTGFRIARFHPSGKLYVNETSFVSLPEAQKHAHNRNALIADISGNASMRGFGEYFVWHQDMSQTDLEANRPENHANEIK